MLDRLKPAASRRALARADKADFSRLEPKVQRAA